MAGKTAASAAKEEEELEIAGGSEGSEEGEEEEEGLEDTPPKPDLVPVQRNQCPHCFVQFTLEKNYVDHMWTVHGSKRPFRCDDCGIFLSYRSSLYNHKKIHSDKRPFACSDCAAKFRWNNSLKYHMARAHQKVAIITAKQVTATQPLPAPLPSSSQAKAQATKRRTTISTAIDNVLERVKEESAADAEAEAADLALPSPQGPSADAPADSPSPSSAFNGSRSPVGTLKPPQASPSTSSARKTSRKAARPSRIEPAAQLKVQAEEEEEDLADTSGGHPSLPDDSPQRSSQPPPAKRAKKPAKDLRVEVLEEIQRQQGALLAQMEAFEAWMRAQFDALNASIALIAHAPLALAQANGH